MSSKLVAGNGIFMKNGLNLSNGFNLGNGMNLSNGLNLSNGINLANGFNLANGMNLANGLPVAAINPPAGSDLEKWIDQDPTNKTRILRYLVECALPSAGRVGFRYRGQPMVVFNGSVGLGTSIMSGAMTQAHREAVSACLLARVNAKGESVQINLFGPFTGMSTATDQEIADWPMIEAYFFGDLFSSTPQATVIFEWLKTQCDTRICRRPDGSCDCGVATAGLIRSSVGECTIDHTSPNGSWAYMTGCKDGTGKAWNYAVTARIKPAAVGAACTGNPYCKSQECGTNGLCKASIRATFTVASNGSVGREFQANKYDNFYSSSRVQLRWDTAVAVPFTIHDLNGGSLVSGEPVYFRGHNSTRWVLGSDGYIGQSPGDVAVTNFNLIKVSGGDTIIRSGDRVVIKASTTGKFGRERVTVHTGYDSRALLMDQTSQGSATVFTVTLSP